jgi:hypothetical protein
MRDNRFDTVLACALLLDSTAGIFAPGDYAILAFCVDRRTDAVARWITVDLWFDVDWC